MSPPNHDRLDAVALLVAVCSGILDDAIDNDGQDLDTGEYLSQAAVDEVHQAVRVGMPTTPDHDRYMFATGICTGLAAALRFLEAQQLEADDYG